MVVIRIKQQAARLRRADGDRSNDPSNTPQEPASAIGRMTRQENQERLPPV